MPLINATWKVTHDGVILLDWTDYMQSEPQIDRAFLVDRFAALVAGGGMAYFGRENLFHTVTFSQVRVFDNDFDAREFMRSQTIAVSSEQRPCLITWLDTLATNTLLGAVITSYRARCENNFFFADYSLQGGVLS
jgi:hypothetical protein